MILSVACAAVAGVGGTLAAQSSLRSVTDGRSICLSYEPSRLAIAERPDGTWRLSRHDGAIFRSFADREDAEAGLAVARQYTQWCYIGKSNTRPDRVQFVMEYLK